MCCCTSSDSKYRNRFCFDVTLIGFLLLAVRGLQLFHIFPLLVEITTFCVPGNDLGFLNCFLIIIIMVLMNIPTKLALLCYMS